jgi:hypothetical protein
LANVSKQTFKETTMLNLMDRDITYTHRKSDFTQDVFVSGCWVASATCNHAGEEVADEVQYRGLLNGDTVDIPMEPQPPTEGDPEPPDRPRAVTLQSLAIEAKIVTCGYCRGIHHIQKCPALRHAVSVASWVGVDLGRGLCQLRWRNHDGFTQLLESVTPARLVEYAESYVAFIKDNRPESSLTTHEVLDRWLPLIGDDPGPAAPAMRMVA